MRTIIELSTNLLLFKNNESNHFYLGNYKYQYNEFRDEHIQNIDNRYRIELFSFVHILLGKEDLFKDISFKEFKDIYLKNRKKVQQRFIQASLVDLSQYSE